MNSSYIGIGLCRSRPVRSSASVPAPVVQAVRWPLFCRCGYTRGVVMTLNPQVQQIIARCNEWDAAHPSDKTAEFERFRIHCHRHEIWKPEYLSVGYFLDRTIPGPGGDLPIRIYRPLRMTDSSTHSTVIYVHGGGWS